MGAARAHLREGRRAQDHAVVVAVAAHCPVLVGQDDVPVCVGGVKGEPGHCGTKPFHFINVQRTHRGSGDLNVDSLPEGQILS